MTKIKLPLVSEGADLEKVFTYSNDLEFDLNRPLFITVKKPYIYWRTFAVTEGLKRQIEDNEGGEEKDIREYLPKEERIYNPFEEFTTEKFLNVVMSVDLKDMDSILNFYNTYGPLIYTGYGVNEGEIENNLVRMSGLHEQTAMEKVYDFISEMTVLQWLIYTYEDLQANNIDSLRNSPYLLSVSKISKDTPNDEVIKISMRCLMFAINKKANLINPVIAMNNSEFTKRITSSCLLGVFYIRLYELVTENQKTNRCRFCGDYFIPRKSDANFCPPTEANERSKCTNRYDAMVRRAREWHFKEGLTVEEIQEKITKPKARSKKEIQHWIDTYNGKMKK